MVIYIEESSFNEISKWMKDCDLKYGTDWTWTRVNELRTDSIFKIIMKDGENATAFKLRFGL